MLDLHAEIIPGIKAAGFAIGESLDDVRARLGAIQEWADGQRAPSGETIWEYLAHYDGWILTFNPRTEEYSLWSRSVSIGFSRKSQTLYTIFVSEGYKGKYDNHLGVGSLLSEAFRYGDWEFDDGDEMFFPIDASAKSLGLAASSPEYFDDFASRPIFGISVHDWDISKRER